MKRYVKKRRKNSKKRLPLLCSFLVLSCFLFFGIKHIYYINSSVVQTVHPKKILVDLDFIYSDTLRSNILSFVDSYVTTSFWSTFDPYAFNKKVSNQFKIIKKVVWDYANPDVAKITLKGAKPFCRINNQFILADNKQIFDTKYFETYDLEIIKNVSLPANFFDNTISNNIYSFLEKVSPDSWLKYNLNYLKNSSITLSDKHNEVKGTKVLFLSDDDGFFNYKKWELSEKIKDDLLDRKNRKKHYVVDLRFNNRVVMKPINKVTFNFLQKSIFECGSLKNRGMG